MSSAGVKRFLLKRGGLQVFTAALFLFLLTATSCSGKKAEELFKTAQFEELQTNWEHAGELYERILADYPESGEAGKAKGRLKELSVEGKYRAGAQP